MANTSIPLVFAAAAAAAAVAASLLPVASWAEGDERAPGVFEVPEQATVARRFPAIFGIASAVPGRGGSAFAGVTYANPRGGISGNGGDGDITLGYTLGNPVTGLSVGLGVAITGLDPLGEAGVFYLSAARVVASSERSATFAGASLSNFGAWGSAEDTEESAEVYVSHLTSIQSKTGEFPVQLTLGYGSEVKYTSDSKDTEGGVFFGAGIGLTEWLSAGLSGTDNQLNAGVGVSIPGLEGWSVSAGVFDVTDNMNRQQVSLTVSYGFSNLFGGL